MYAKFTKVIIISTILILASLVIVLSNYEENEFLVIKNSNFKNEAGMNLSSPNFSLTYNPQDKNVNFRIYDDMYECSYIDLEKAKIIFSNKYFECINSTLLIEKYALDVSEFEEVLKVVKNSSLDFTISKSRITIQNSVIFQLEILLLIIVVLYIINYNSKTIEKILDTWNIRKIIINLSVFILIILAILIKNVDPNVRREMNYNQISTKDVPGTAQLSLAKSKTNFEIGNAFVDLVLKSVPEGKILIVGSKNLIDIEIDKETIYIQNIAWAKNLNRYRLPHNCNYPCSIHLSVLSNKSIVMNVNSKILLYAPIEMREIELSDLSPISIRTSGVFQDFESRLYFESIDLRKYSIYSLVGMLTIMILLAFSLIPKSSLRKIVRRRVKRP